MMHLQSKINSQRFHMHALEKSYLIDARVLVIAQHNYRIFYSRSVEKNLSY